MKNKKSEVPRFTAFNGHEQIVSGSILEVTKVAKQIIDNDRSTSLLIFNDTSGEQIDLDLNGSKEEVVAKQIERFGIDAGIGGSSDQNQPPKNKPGRPKLGVVSREVTLQPKHWEWLGKQSGSASVTLRKLVEQAMRTNKSRDRIRASQDATFKFMNSMAGNLPNYEEAIRALYNKDRHKFNRLILSWSKDIQTFAKKLSISAWDES